MIISDGSILRNTSTSGSIPGSSTPHGAYTIIPAVWTPGARRYCWTINAIAISEANTQTMTRAEALRMYMLGSAYLSWDDDKLGCIEVGKLADLAVLSDDPLTA